MRPGFSLSVSALLAASALFCHGPPEGHTGAAWALCRLPLQWIPQVLLLCPCWTSPICFGLPLPKQASLDSVSHLGEHTCTPSETPRLRIDG